MTDLTTYLTEQIAARPVEALMVRKVVRALKAAGTPVVRIWDGEEHVRVTSEKDVMDTVFNLDEAVLKTADGAGVFLVMGEGYEMICDYSVSLEDALAPVNAYVDAHL